MGKIELEDDIKHLAGNFAFKKKVLDAIRRRATACVRVYWKPYGVICFEEDAAQGVWRGHVEDWDKYAGKVQDACDTVNCKLADMMSSPGMRRLLQGGKTR